MAQVKSGDTVTIHFTGKLEDGTIIETTLPTEEETAQSCGCGDDHSKDDCECDDCGCGESGPYTFTLGNDEFLPQIEEALIGMAPGEKKTLVLHPDDAFGEYDDEAIFTVPRSELPEDLVAEPGVTIEFTDDNEEWSLATILEVTDEDVTLDANHPLAGQIITYDIELLEIQ